MSNHIVFDEIAYFQREPTVMESMFQTLANSHSWVRETDQKSAQRTYEKLKRKREQENCLHGRRLFEIHYRMGTHPLGDHIFYANIEGMAGGPYLLNEADHQILHDVGRKHEHVKTEEVPTPKD